MTMPRQPGRPPDPDRACRRCARPRSEHVGEQHACPDGAGVLSVARQRFNRASASFSPDELQLLDEVLRTLLRGGDARQLIRTSPKALQGLSAVVARMRTGINERTRKETTCGEQGIERQT